jgi:O-antigen ligase
MPPVVALCLAWICALAFLKFDPPLAGRKISPATWIPTIWLLIVCSRPVANWFAVQDTNRSRTAGLNPAEVYSDGTPLDRNIFLTLIILGICVLLSRRIKWGEVIRKNKWLVLFAAYGLVSVLWSDFPLVSFKRWVKLGGIVIMGLIIATEAHPTEAFRRVFARVTYVLIPLSIVLIKYYGAYGRRFNPHTGFMTVTGVTTQKNELGLLCMLAAIFLVWSWTSLRDGEKPSTERWRWYAHLGCASMVAWLLYQAQSTTATVTAVFGVATVVFFARSRGSQFRMLTPALLGSVALLALLYVTGIVEAFILALGEDLTLTGRTDLWAEVLAAGTNPLIGAGFESFWLGSVAEQLWQKYWWHPNQAHNGFIETYINLGIVGLVLLCGYLAHAYSASLERMRAATVDPTLDIGRFALTFVVIALLTNVTEASFHGTSLLWVTQIICNLRYTAATVPVPSPSPVAVRTVGARRPRPSLWRAEAPIRSPYGPRAIR